MAYETDSEDGDDKDLVAEGIKCFALCQDRDSLNRNNWIDDVRFARLSEQWPEEIRQQRQREGRPCLTINRLPAFIRQVTNDARQNTPSIKFHPVGDGADQVVAKILDGLARNIEYSSDADVAYDNALDNAVTGGFGYFRITTDYATDDAFDQDIRIDPIKNPLTVYGDPYSYSSDSADWNECFVTELIPRKEFEKRWPKAEAIDFNADSHDVQDWFREDEVRVAEWWRRKEVPAKILLLSNGTAMHQEQWDENEEFFSNQGITIVDQRDTTTQKVTQYIMSGCEILETNDWAGKYIPIVPVYGDEVIVDGERHFISMIRFAKDSQQMFNFWRTASTELVALAPKTPFIGAVGQFNTDAAKWQTANTVSHPYIEYDQADVNGTPAPPPSRQPFAGPPAGALQEALNAADDMKSIMGIFDASLGAQSNETSGRAILARQREGDTSTFNFTDNLSRAIRHAGRILCDLIPKIYNTQRIIRIIQEDGTTENVPIGPYEPTPEQQASGMAKVFDLTAGKYDVTCETGPSYNTRREEAANQMIEFIRANPASAPIIGDLLAKNLDWPGADQIADRLKAMLPPQVQGQNPETQALQQQLQQVQQQSQQVIQQLQQQLQQAQQDQAAAMAKAQNDNRKVDVDIYNAETNRLKVTSPAMTPEQVQMLVLQTIQQLLSAPDPNREEIQEQPIPPQGGPIMQ